MSDGTRPDDIEARRHTQLIELTRLLAGDGTDLDETLTALVSRFPKVLRLPERGAARVTYRSGQQRLEKRSEGFATPWRALSARLELEDHGEASIELSYLEPVGEATDPFAPAERSTFEAVAALLRAYLERRAREQRTAELQGELERRTAVQRKLLDVYTRYLAHDPADVATAVLEAAVAAIPGARLGSVLMRTEQGNYRFAAVHGYDMARMATIRLPADVVLFGHDWREGRAFVVRDMASVNARLQRERPDMQAIIDIASDTAAVESLVAPVLLAGELVAAITLEHTDAGHAFSRDSGELLQLFAQSIGALLQRTEAEARADLMARAVDASSDGIAILDLPVDTERPLARYANPAFMHLLGIEPGGLERWAPESVLGAELTRRVATIMLHVASRGEAARLEAPVPRPDGGRRHLEASVTRLEHEACSSRLLIVVRDVTARYRHLAELEHLNADLRARLDEARTIDGIDAAITGSYTTDATLARVTAEIGARPGVAGVGLLVVDDHARPLRFVASHGLVPRPLGERTVAADDPAERSRRLREHLVVDAETSREAYEGASETQHRRTGAHHSWPLLVRDEVVGVLEVYLEAGFEPDTDWHRFMVVVAAQSAIAVEHSATIERLGRSSKAYARLAEFSGQIEDVDDPEELIDLGVSTLLQEFGMQGAIHYRVEGERIALHRQWGEVPPAVAAAFRESGAGSAGPIARAAATREPVYLEDYVAWERSDPYLAALGIASLLALPICGDDQVESIIVIAAFGRPVVLRSDQIAVARAFVRRLERALERGAYQRQIERTREEAFRSLGTALEYRDFETKGHTDRVVALSRRLGARVGLDEDQLEALAWGAYLHDLGKITVPDQILLKPAWLTRDEFAQVERHAMTGFEMSLDLAFLPDDTREVIRAHHEHWDGSGYPDGLAGEEIPYLARVFALADVYDALTSERPYKVAWTHEEAAAEIAVQAGRHFDPELTAAMLALLSEDHSSP